MLPHRLFTASLQHLPSLANPMITGADHQVNKEKLIWTPGGTGHKKTLLESKACSNLYVSGFYSRLMCPSL